MRSLNFTGGLIPHLIDQRAESTPNAIFAEYPISTLSYAEGYRRITYTDLANAVDAAAHWLVSTLDRSQEFETLAYIGPNDLRYPALIVGAVKAGYKLFLTSPRNSVAAHFNLFGRLQCRTLLSATPRPPAVTAIQGHGDIRIIEVPNVSFFLDTKHPHFNYNKSWPEAHAEPLFVIHTSGSTGIPKPLLYTHASAATNIKMMSLDPPPGYESQDRIYQGKRVFITFPPFHGAYLVSYLFNAIPFGTVMIAPTSGALPSGEGLVEGLKKSSADVAITVPSIVQDLAQDAQLLEYCAENLQTIIFCGGDLPQSIGDTVATRIRLLNQFGASELGLTPNILHPDRRSTQDWKYVQFHPLLGLDLREVSDGLHELYAVRSPEKKDIQPTFTIFPDVQEYASRDLFARHPSTSKADLWSWQSRADDIIVFLNGEKTNPISMEQKITSHHKDISAVLVIGAQRFQAALLIEPLLENKSMNTADRAVFLEAVWPTIEEANKEAPTHARVMKSHVMFTSPHKPMLRAGKGTVQRSGTLKSHAKEIDALYKDAETMSSYPICLNLAPEAISNRDMLLQPVREAVLSTMEWSSLDDSRDFFERGMDSVHVLALVRRLRQTLTLPTLMPSTVYTSPSTLALTDAILRLADLDKTSKASEQEARVKERNALIAEYKKRVDERLSRGDRKLPKDGREVIVLTGSTGNLGSYLLNAMLDDPKIAHIYCLDHKPESLLTRRERNRRVGITSSPDGKRVSFMTVDLSKELFGLDKAEYEDLALRTTRVIHNAWTVNFNFPLHFFRAQLDGLVNLLNSADTSKRSTRLFYVSSVSSVMAHRSESGFTPEEVIASDSAPGPTGYAESKFVAEQIINYAAEKGPLSHSLAFARVGQIAGAARHDGIWNTDEWFPSLVASSVDLGIMPKSLGPMFDLIDWVPIDILSSIILELIMRTEYPVFEPDTMGRRALTVYHPLNPNEMTWTVLQEILVKELASYSKTPIAMVSLPDWIAKLRKRTQSILNSHEESDRSPSNVFNSVSAAKLLGFFEGLAASEGDSMNQLSCTATLKSSNQMQKLRPLDDTMFRKWIREWFSTTSVETS